MRRRAGECPAYAARHRAFAGLQVHEVIRRSRLVDQTTDAGGPRIALELGGWLGARP